MGTNFWDAILSPFAVQLGKGIMLAVWTATFVHIVLGAKQKVLMQMSGAMMGYQVASLIANYYFFNWTGTLYYALMNSIFIGIALILFNWVHVEVAWIYRSIAKSAPLAIKNEQLSVAEVQKDKRKFLWLVMLNLLTPTITSVVGFVGDVSDQPKTIKLFGAAWSLLYTLNVFLQVVTGWISIASLREIRAFYVSQNATHLLKNRKMLLHVSAFGLFLVAYLIKAGVDSLQRFGLVTTSTQVKALAFYAYLNLVSQILLARVFWTLGSKKGDQVPVQGEDADALPTIVVEDFDADADVQAQIWNQFVRNPDSEFIVSTQSVVQTGRGSIRVVNSRVQAEDE